MKYVLVGGPADGRRVSVQGDATHIKVPCRQKLTSLSTKAAGPDETACTAEPYLLMEIAGVHRSFFVMRHADASVDQVPRYHDFRAAGVELAKAWEWHDAIRLLESHAETMCQALEAAGDEGHHAEHFRQSRKP